jgi:hypothetical protein
VRFNDLCGLTSATIGGSTTFNNARFVSTTGKNYVFAVGTTQAVGAILEIAGTTPNPIQFRSGTPGQVANVNLLPAGTQQIQHVGVTDVWATGQHLAPNLTNEGGGGKFRWFRSSSGSEELRCRRSATWRCPRRRAAGRISISTAPRPRAHDACSFHSRNRP